MQLKDGIMRGIITAPLRFPAAAAAAGVNGLVFDATVNMSLFPDLRCRRGESVKENVCFA